MGNLFMEVNIDININAMCEYTRYTLRDRIKKLNILLVIVLIIFLSSIYFIITQSYYDYFGFSLFALVLILICRLKLSYKNIYKQIALQATIHQGATKTLKIYEDGLILSTVKDDYSSDLRFEYSYIKNIIVVNNYVYLVFKDNRYTLLYKNEHEDAINYITSKCKNSF